MNRLQNLSKPRYGAFELKAKYRQNMLLGTMISALLAIATTACTFLFTSAEQLPVIIKQDRKVDSILVDINRWVRDTPKPPKIETSGRLSSGDRGMPIPVPGDEIINDTVIIVSINDPYVIGGADNNKGEVGDHIGDPGYGGGSGYYPDPNKFVKCEVMPEMIYEHQPDYPRLAQTASMEAVVWIKALVDINGSVHDAMIFVSSNSRAGFNKAALKAAYKCKYKPGIQNKRPVPVWVSYKVEFVLEGKW